MLREDYFYCIFVAISAISRFRADGSEKSYPDSNSTRAGRMRDVQVFRNTVYLVQSWMDSGIGLERSPGGGRPSRVDPGYIRDAVRASSMTSILHPPDA